MAIADLFLIPPCLFQAFSPVELPSLSYLNIRGNPMEQNSVAVLLEVLKEFPCLQSLEVVMFDIATILYMQR